MRYFIHLAYNGSAFFGWQIQPNNNSVQETLEKCLSLILHHEHINITGCGRTDTGVHASSYYAHFDIENDFSASECQKITDNLNNFLPKEIVIFKIFKVKTTAHARFDAQNRTYQYFISTKKNPFKIEFCYHYHRNLDIERMNTAASLLTKNKDFTSFSKVNTQVNNFLCEVSEAIWTQDGEIITFTITANRFLRNMVRAIVGTLLEVGIGKISVEDFQKIIESKNRCSAKTSAPAHALFLTNVRYLWDNILLNDNQ